MILSVAPVDIIIIIIVIIIISDMQHDVICVMSTRSVHSLNYDYNQTVLLVFI